jgi:hypothetical protein
MLFFSVFFLWGYPNFMPLVTWLTGYHELTQVFFITFFKMIFLQLLPSTLSCLIIRFHGFI